MENFELYLRELNQIVKELESGELSLNESIKKYQRGIELSALCKEALAKAKELIVETVSEK